MNTITIGLPIEKRIDENEIVQDPDNTAISLRIITLRDDSPYVGVIIQIDGIYKTESGYEKINNSILDVQLMDPEDGAIDLFENGSKFIAVTTGVGEAE